MTILQKTHPFTEEEITALKAVAVKQMSMNEYFDFIATNMAKVKKDFRPITETKNETNNLDNDNKPPNYSHD